MFTRIANLIGLKDPISNINKLDISEMILNRFSGLSLEEVDYAFRLERYGVYKEKTDHFQLFNTDYVSSILNKYKTWLRETRFKYNLPIVKKDQKTELSDQDKELIKINGIINCFEYFRQNNTLPTLSAWVYDELYQIGALPYHSKKFKKRIKRKALKAFADKKSENLEEFKKIKQVVQGIEQGKNRLAVKCKQIVLEEYFQKLINTGKDFNQEFSRFYKISKK